MIRYLGRVLASFLLLLPAALWSADATAASAEDVQWFVGTWSVTRVEPPGFDSIVAPRPTTATITHLRDNRIARASALRSGERTSAEFTVMSFGGNFPWWTDDGTSVVARRVDADTFLLAVIGPDGRADWDNAWRHVRAPAGSASQ